VIGLRLLTADVSGSQEMEDASASLVNHPEDEGKQKRMGDDRFDEDALRDER
jgi:hypothetical protein